MTNESTDQIIFPVLGEVLDVDRNWVQTGEINCYKEVLTEDKTVTVPVKREELVIEQKILDKDSPGRTTRTETMRIPLREERLEIKKYTYDLEKVHIYKRQVHDTQVVDAILNKEVVHVKSTGDFNVKTN